MTLYSAVPTYAMAATLHHDSNVELSDRPPKEAAKSSNTILKQFQLKAEQGTSEQGAQVHTNRTFPSIKIALLYLTWTMTALKSDSIQHWWSVSNHWTEVDPLKISELS